MPGPDLPLEEARFIAFDTETTGLYPVVGRLLEIGATCFRLDGEEIAVFEQLIDPETEIPADAQAVNHITDEMVRGQPTISEVMPGFIDFLGDTDHLLLAHNAPFDLGFIGVAMVRLGIALPRHMVFDTLAVAKSLAPGLRSYSLEPLSIMLGATGGQSHRALSDARLAADVFRSLLKRDPEARTLADLARVARPLSFECARGYRVRHPEGFEDLAAAIDRALIVEIVYEGGTKGLEPRRVTPRAFLRTSGYLYLAAHCHVDDREKMYRLDRIKSFRLL
jgi:DNA polymerase III epsilon subunit family exonuclease